MKKKMKKRTREGLRLLLSCCLTVIRHRHQINDAEKVLQVLDIDVADHAAANHGGF